MINMPEFRSGQGANQAHIALKKSIEIRDQAQHCAVLWFADIMHRKLHRELGFSTMRAYALEGLGFSPTRAGDFITLANKLEKLPTVKEEMSSGKIGYTVAREIVAVADPNNEKDWLKTAAESSRQRLRTEIKQARELAKQKRKANPNQGELMPRQNPETPTAVVPARILIEMTPTQFARYEAVLKKLDHRGNRAELILDAVEALAVATDNTRRRVVPDYSPPQTQIHVHACPECNQLAVATPKGELKLSGSEAQTVQCDAMISEPGVANRSVIPPRIRREVLARDRYRCRRKGCHHTRHLDIHHLKPRLQAGDNTLDNLVTLCTQCHQLWHKHGGDLQAVLGPVPGGG